MQSTASRKSDTGSTLVEYMMIGGTILLISIGVCILMGGNLQNILKGLKADFQGSSAKASAATVKVSTGSPVPSAGPGASAGSTVQIGGTTIPSSSAINGVPTQKVCFSSGYCVNVPVVAQGPMSGTTGALGGQLTGAFADVLQQIADQLTANSGDRVLAGMITKLANNGHAIGNQQSSLLSLCAPGTQCNSSITINTNSGKAAAKNGSTVTAGIYLTGINDANLQFKNQYGAVISYLKKNPDALAPELQSLVTLESQQIIGIADAFNTTTSVNNGVTSNTVHKKVTTTAQSTWDITSDPILVHQDANTICGAGGDTSVCVQ